MTVRQDLVALCDRNRAERAVESLPTEGRAGCSLLVNLETADGPQKTPLNLKAPAGPVVLTRHSLLSIHLLRELYFLLGGDDLCGGGGDLEGGAVRQSAI